MRVYVSNSQYFIFICSHRRGNSCDVGTDALPNVDYPALLMTTENNSSAMTDVAIDRDPVQVTSDQVKDGEPSIVKPYKKTLVLTSEQIVSQRWILREGGGGHEILVH